ncbi:AbrB/MazE/SpoVT family DNA-binding domain-containing protein [Candidatus Woesearchaeota archaeon]|nr:AbrB/MazE/SpoVT family DNA-binding domain-containing protein [Candidatus Woesearchaeota archaeon]
MSITKVTRNHQITVPRDIREQTHIEEGDTLIVTLDKDEIRLKKMEADIFLRVFGSWKSVKDSVSYVKTLRKDWEKREKRLQQ